MSVDWSAGLPAGECDECGATLPGEVTFEDAVAAMRRAGWKSVKSKKTGRTENFCKNCQEDGYATEPKKED